jgi:drug/metabolite transporter (DMT)-like permease
MSRIFTALFAALLLHSFVFLANAHAYLDPGTGSYILQMLVAGLLGAAFAIKIFWMRIRRFFTGVFSRGNRND